MKRIEWLDRTKGLAIVLFVLGHALTTSIRNDSLIANHIYNWVYYFHMPLFMTLSGISYQLANNHYLNETIVTFIRKKAKRLILPYVVYVSLVYLVFFIANILPRVSNMAQNAGYGIITLKQFFIGMFLGDNFYCIHMWYLFALFILTLLTFVLRKYFTRYGDIILFVILISLYFIKCITLFPETKAISNIFYFGIWFFIGLKLPFNKLNKSLGYSCLMFGIFIYMLKYFNMLYINPQLVFIVDLFIKGSIVVGIISLFTVYENKVFDYLGKHSMEIYLFHQPFWESCFGSVFYGVLHLPLLVVVIVSFILSIIIPLIISEFLYKIKLNILFGLK